MIFDRFRKNKEDLSSPPPIEAELPEDLERFRVRAAQEIKPVEIPRNDYPIPEITHTKTVEELVAERTGSDKIELILQKLETIDARLRLLEEKMKRY